MTTMTTKNKTKPKTRPFKMFYVGKEWDMIFLLPPPAFKLWMYYYRLEPAKREGWATREQISEKCGMAPDAVTDWRKWLVKNGWMRKVGEHKTPNNPLASSPIMQVCRGTIPATVDRRGKSAGSRTTQFKREREISHTVDTENLPHRPVTEFSHAPVRQFSSGAVPETSRHDVDVIQKLDKPPVDGPVESGLKGSSQATLPEGVTVRSVPDEF
jgi:hypothetical protein